MPLRLPEPLVRLFLLTVRYLSLTRSEARRLHDAMAGRGLSRRASNRHTWRSYGYLIGMLLVRALDRAQRVEGGRCAAAAFPDASPMPPCRRRPWRDWAGFALIAALAGGAGCGELCMSALIALDQISVSRDGVPVLNHAAMRLDPGERLAIVGPNGAGKTTLLRTIVGLERAETGTITLFGTPCAGEKDFRAARPRIGFLFQDSEDQLFCPSVIEGRHVRAAQHRQFGGRGPGAG